MNGHPTPLLELREIHKSFRIGKKKLEALSGLNLSIHPGETWGVVGESGCGKSTLGKVILHLEKPTSGSVFFQGQSLDSFSSKQMKCFRQKAQLIFQDPYSSLNPRMCIEEIISEGLEIHGLASGEERRAAIENSVVEVGLDPSVLTRYPHEFSGGQRQRIVIARALIINPLFVVCDEPLSSLDVSTQKQVMDLLKRLKRERSLTYLFISHDLNAVKEIADFIAVMYLGRIVEIAPTKTLFDSPKHPYTQALLSAIPIPDPVKERNRPRLLLTGEPSTPLKLLQGCPFHPRCPHAMPLCQMNSPPKKEFLDNHYSVCHQ